MVNYLKQFSPVLTELSELLRRLCKQGVVWAWEFKQQTALETIKKIITTLPVLASFNSTKEHIIQSDVSKTGLGAVFIQESRSVVYASRALTDIEQRYSNIERGVLKCEFCTQEAAPLHIWTHNHSRD